MSLLLNMLSRLVITILPRSKRLLISCQYTLFQVLVDFKLFGIIHLLDKYFVF